MNLCLQRWDACDWLSWHGSSRSSALHPEPNGHINQIKHFQRGGSELQSPHYHFVAVLRLQSEWSQYCFWRNAEVDIRYRWICPAVLRLIIRQQTRWTRVRRVVCWMTLFVLHLKVEPGSVFCCIRASCFWSWQDFHQQTVGCCFPHDYKRQRWRIFDLTQLYIFIGSRPDLEETVETTDGQ